jgi:hypothetical protein
LTSLTPPFARILPVSCHDFQSKCSKVQAPHPLFRHSARSLHGAPGAGRV